MTQTDPQLLCLLCLLPVVMLEDRRTLPPLTNPSACSLILTFADPRPLPLSCELPDDSILVPVTLRIYSFSFRE